MDSALERRGSARHRDAAPISVSYFIRGRCFSARSLDYSSSGIGFEMAVPLNQGADVYIRRENGSDPAPSANLYEGFRTVALAKIKWCREISTGPATVYRFGAEYHQPFL